MLVFKTYVFSNIQGFSEGPSSEHGEDKDWGRQRSWSLPQSGPSEKIWKGSLWCLSDDSSSLTNEKDHHYFLNSADVCW